jgi:hypothetical protein
MRPDARASRAVCACLLSVPTVERRLCDHWFARAEGYTKEARIQRREIKQTDRTILRRVIDRT